MKRTHRRARRAAAVVATVVSAGLAVVASPPAFAATTSDPLAIGVGRSGDTRVLEASGTSESSTVRVAAYVPGSSGSARTQRWTFEQVPSESPGDYEYRIRNVASGLCLARWGSGADGDTVGVRTCGSGWEQVWSLGMPYYMVSGGWELQSVTDFRCVSITGASESAGAQTEIRTCDHNAWHQRWQPRTGPFDCGVRSNQEFVAAMCAASVDLRKGVMANWRQQPVGFAALDPNTYPDANYARTFVREYSATDTGGDATDDAVELGWEASYAAGAHDTTYHAYWLEWGKGKQEYHNLAGTPRAADADGRVHTYMLMPASGGQWDVLYDFIPVGTSHLQEGSRTKQVRTGLATRYTQAVVADTAYESRLQVRDSTGLWQRPTLAGVATGATKPCNSPIIEDDPLPDQANTPPWCTSVSLATKNNSGAATAEVDRVLLSKPAAATATPSTHTAVPPAVRDPQTRALAELTPAETGRRELRTPRVTTRSTTVAAFDATAGTHIAAQFDAQTPVDVVTGDSTVHSLGGNDDVYRGWTLVYAAGGGQLLYACLGRGCAS